MAVMTLRFNPPSLGLATQVRILLPTGIHPQDTDFRKLYADMQKFPVLWLLHGGSDNYADWHDCTTVQLLSDRYGYAVVMPDAQMSSYANMAHGPALRDYYRYELPEYIYTHFPISRKREDNFISGMSMGGAGALKFALLDPQRYSVCVPISSGVEVVRNYAARTGRATSNKFFQNIYGHEDDPSGVLGTEEDIYWLLEQNVKNGTELPRFEFCVGLEDFTREGNLEFHRFASSLGVQIPWVEEHGIHDWNSWNLYIPEVFSFICRCRMEAGLE